MILLAIGLLVADMGITAKNRANQEKEFQEQLLQDMRDERREKQELAEQVEFERELDEKYAELGII